MSKQEDYIVKASTDAGYEVHPIFPVPIYTRENIIKEKEIPFLEEVVNSPMTPYVPAHDLYGDKSENSYILDQFGFNALKIKLEIYLQEYANVILGLAGEFAITQSWLSIKKSNQQHIMHSHANSIVSGVFYFNNVEDASGLTFMKNRTATDTWSMSPLVNPNVNNQFSFNEITLKVENHMVVMFPSYIAHKVTENKTDKPRYSIAFNAVPKYALGWEQELTELEYRRVDRR
jgi:uncharacterized protein (TIGR02466 family)